MEALDKFIGSPLFATFAGWLGWTVLMLSIYKDENEKTFNLKAYAAEHWDNWLTSLVFIPILLYIGYNKLKLGTGLVEAESLDWSDLYYLFSGFAVEVAKMAWKKWKSKNA